MEKTYLGDSVYVEEDLLGIMLTTDNGFGASNTIILEPEVIVALEEFLKALKEELSA